MAVRLSDLPRSGVPRMGALPVPNGLARWTRPLLVGLAVGGAIMGIGSVLWAYALGMWPPHDTSAYWLAGRHILEGKAVYGGAAWYLAFVYAPPLAILMAPLSLWHYNLLALLLVGLQLAALRYVTGSWRVTAILGWIPWVHSEFVAGNIDCLMAAAIYASVTERRGAGVGIALFALAKVSPALVLIRASRRQWIEFAVTSAVLLAITVPTLHLWPDWIARLENRGPYEGFIPLLVRLPIAGALLIYRRPWSVAAGAALATPVFYTQSIVLLLPAARLLWDARRSAVSNEAPQIAAADGRPAAGVISLGLTAEAPAS